MPRSAPGCSRRGQSCLACCRLCLSAATLSPQRLPLGARSFSRSAPATPARASAALRRLTTTAAPAAAEETTARAVLDALRADLARKTGGLTPAKLRIVAGWLGFTAAAVFAMIVLGGITRLTRSGLSMVEWRPEGSKLPSTDEEWEVAFDKYKQFPEYKVVNSVRALQRGGGGGVQPVLARPGLPALHRDLRGPRAPRAPRARCPCASK